MATNPILGELATLSPAAKSALMQAHQQASTPQAPPRLITDPNGPNQLPPAVGPAHIAAPPPMPTTLLSGAPSTPALPARATPSAKSGMPAFITPPDAQPNLPPPMMPHVMTPDPLTRGSGISQIHSKIENSSFGQNHPLLGKVLGWGAQVPAMLADTAGSAVAPGIAVNVPGTEYHHERLVNQEQSRNTANTDIAGKQAQTAEAEARTADMPAAAQRQQEQLAGELATHGLGLDASGHVAPLPPDQLSPELQEKLHPQAKDPFQLWQQQNPHGTAEQYNTSLQHPLTQADADARNGVWNTIAAKYHLPQNQFRPGMSGADATQLAAAMNNVIGRNQGAQSIVIKQEGATNAAGNRQDAATQKEYQAAAKDLNNQFSTAQTQKDALETAQQELAGGAVGQAAGTIKTLVGLAGGKGTGVRITQAELNALAHARGIQGDFEGFINKISGQGALSGPQLAQMQSLLSDVEGRIQQKMQLQDNYLDQLGNASSPQEIRKIQSQYRKELLSPKNEGAAPQSGAGGVIRARDPQGNIHTAPAGTKLPQGWQPVQ